MVSSRSLGKRGSREEGCAKQSEQLMQRPCGRKELGEPENLEAASVPRAWWLEHVGSAGQAGDMAQLCRAVCSNEVFLQLLCGSQRLWGRKEERGS